MAKAHHRNYYEVLKIAVTASHDEVETAYQNLRAKYKKLSQSGDEDYLKLLHETEEAYAVLSDAVKRVLYDQDISALALQKESESKRVGVRPEFAPKWTKSKFFSWWQLLLLVATGGMLFLLNFYAKPPGVGVMAGLWILLLGGVLLVYMIKQKSITGVYKALIAGAVCLAVNFFTYTQFQQQQLYIDNQNDFAVYVNVDDWFFCELGPLEYDITGIRPGLHAFKTYKADNDSLLETFTTDIELVQSNLYNVLSAGEYAEGKQTYSMTGWSVGGSHSYSRNTVRGRWISLDKYSYVFEYPPDEIKVKLSNGTSEVTRSYLVRKNQPEFIHFQY
jgi:curved DNA-binding protein CbpA